MTPRRAAAGLVLGAAGMIASRLSGRRMVERAPDAAPPPPTGDDIKRARAELAEELARRSARPDNSRG